MPDARTFSALQSHLTGRPLELPTNATELWRSLRMALIHASNARKIKSSPREITDCVLLLDEPPPQVSRQLREQNLHRNAACIVGGEKNQNRDPSLPHLKRNDGAWFDFSITVRELDGRLELLAYDFEIRLAPGMGAPFLRFDLNLPDHRNHDRELRCHLHPGYDDILVPAPLMSPIELLTLFIEGARLPPDRKPRAPTDFEVQWLRQTLDAAFGAGKVQDQ